MRKTLGKEGEEAEDIRDKYELGAILGSGSFGQVREAKLKANGDASVRAVKMSGSRAHKVASPKTYCMKARENEGTDMFKARRIFVEF